MCVGGGGGGVESCSTVRNIEKYRDNDNSFMT